MQKTSVGLTDVRAYLESRPVEAELEAIRQAIDVAANTGCRLHIVHVSCGRGVRLVAEGRARGADVTCETCPHYLLLDERDMEEIGAAAKCAPPLRSANDQHELHQGMKDVTTIGSDHSPAPPEMKTAANFFEVWGGISGCQHLLPLLVDMANSSDSAITRERLVALTSTNVAGRFRIQDKGAIAVGNDADLTLVSENAREEVKADSLHYRHKQTPYVGQILRNRVVRTILRGQTVYHDGKLAVRPIGKLVRPAKSSTA